MQTNDNEFDQLIRSMLDNAEEEVPSRVWSSVSSQIGNGTQTKVVSLRWGRIASAVAAVAAVFAGAFIGLTSINHTNTNQSNSNLALDQNERSVEITSTEPQSDLGNVARRSSSRSNTLVAALEPIEPSFEETLERASNDEDAVATEPTSTASSVKKERKQTKNMEIFSDPFEETVFLGERQKPIRRTSISVGGNMFTNGNANGLRPGVIARMGGSLGYETSVTQLSKQSTYSVPISLGIGVRIPVSDRLSIGTGVSYSFLERTFAGIYKEAADGIVTKTINADIRNSMHYVGIPVNLNYDILTGKGVTLYAFAGGEVEKAILNKFRIPTTSDPIFYNEHVSGVQVSAAVGFGVNFAITDYLGLYFDPSLRYYFDCKQPTSIRTQQPLMASFELGLRFNL